MSISISITMAVFALITIIGMMLGAKMGLAESLAFFVALGVAVIMVGIFLRIFSAYSGGNTKQTIIAIVALILLGVIYSLMKVLTKSIKSIAELPVLGFVDKFLGALLGVVLALIIYHVVTAAADMGYLGRAGDIINKDVADSELLTYLKKTDLIEMVMNWKKGIEEKISNS